MDFRTQYVIMTLAAEGWWGGGGSKFMNCDDLSVNCVLN